MSSPPVPPRRWAQSDSEVGPVVQAVVRYAQNASPTPARLEGIRQGVLARAEARHRSRRRPLRAALWAAAALVPVTLVCGWFLIRDPLHEAEPALTVTQEPLAPSLRKDPARAPAREAPSAVPSPTPLPAAVVPKLAASISATPRRAESEIETLQRARRLLSEKPAEALLLTRQHATQHPRSEFTEEREALRIEALARLGRHAEARRLYDGFAVQHPRSLYLRRMGSWFWSEEGGPDAAAHE